MVRVTGVMVKTVSVEFFCYHRDRPGSVALREELLEKHWSYMDRYATEMIARGPTLADDGDTPTGSVHIVGLPAPAAARAFAFDEPTYQAGVYRDVLLRRWRNLLGRTMWGGLWTWSSTGMGSLGRAGIGLPEARRALSERRRSGRRRDHIPCRVAPRRAADTHRLQRNGSETGRRHRQLQHVAALAAAGSLALPTATYSLSAYLEVLRVAGGEVTGAAER